MLAIEPTQKAKQLQAMNIIVEICTGDKVEETYLIMDVTFDNLKEKLMQHAHLIEQCHQTKLQNQNQL